MQDKSLTLTGSSQITAVGVQHLAALTNLNLSGCYNITNEGVQHLTALTNLTSLSLDGHKITDDCVKHLSSAE
jgi:Leucine-rich repeat (LRR) protein